MTHPHKVVSLSSTMKPIAHSLFGEAGVSQVEEDRLAAVLH